MFALRKITTVKRNIGSVKFEPFKFEYEWSGGGSRC